MKKHKYFLINWAPGMKVNELHFIGQENAFIDMISKTVGVCVNEYNYGLLPLYYLPDKGAQFFLSIDYQQQILLNIQEFCAITLGGCIVEFNKGIISNSNQLVASLPDLSSSTNSFKEEASFYIVLTVDPFQRVPYGVPDPAELPCRIPYAIPAYYLNLISADNPKNNFVGEFQLPIGKLIIKDHKASLDESYIPPCSTVNSHSALLEIHARVEQFYSKIEDNSLRIIRSIFQKNQKDKLAGIVQKLCEKIVDFTGNEIADIRSIGKTQPPLYLINKIASFGRLINNTLNYYISDGREEFFNHCIKWCNKTQVQLESCITDVYKYPYNHLDLRSSINKLADFIETIDNLFLRLAELENISDKPEGPTTYVHEGVVKKRRFL